MRSRGKNGPEPRPQDRVRESLENNGSPQQVTLTELLKAFGQRRVDAESGAAIEAALVEAGVSFEPPLTQVKRGGQVTLVLR